MSAGSLTKSSTNVSVLPRVVRFRRESVCTAWMPDKRLSTYMLCNSGWSKPVWYFSATSKTWYSSELNFSGSSDSRFVYYWLWMRRPILISLSNGGGQPNLSQDDLKKIWIPIPGLDEQKEIVRYLDKKTFEVDEHAMKVEEAVEKLLE
jgi:restriction endonuclease S subunit